METCEKPGTGPASPSEHRLTLLHGNETSQSPDFSREGVTSWAHTAASQAPDNCWNHLSRGKTHPKPNPMAGLRIRDQTEAGRRGERERLQLGAGAGGELTRPPNPSTAPPSRALDSAIPSKGRAPHFPVLRAVTAAPGPAHGKGPLTLDFLSFKNLKQQQYSSVSRFFGGPS